jgi:preprotein translocase subunit YajC
VVTIGGLHGTIKSIDETANTVVLEIGTGLKVTFEKSAIMPKGTAPQQN